MKRAMGVMSVRPASVNVCKTPIVFIAMTRNMQRATLKPAAGSAYRSAYSPTCSPSGACASEVALNDMNDDVLRQSMSTVCT